MEEETKTSHAHVGIDRGLHRVNELTWAEEEEVTWIIRASIATSDVRNRPVFKNPDFRK